MSEKNVTEQEAAIVDKTMQNYKFVEVCEQHDNCRVVFDQSKYSACPLCEALKENERLDQVITDLRHR